MTLFYLFTIELSLLLLLLGRHFFFFVKCFVCVCVCVYKRRLFVLLELLKVLFLFKSGVYGFISSGFGCTLFCNWKMV